MKAVRRAWQVCCLFVQQTDNAAEIKGTGINLRTLSLAPRHASPQTMISPKKILSFFVFVFLCSSLLVGLANISLNVAYD